MSEIKCIVPTKSPIDDRNYRLITLPNALQVLLVHDETAEMAAAGLDVCVGHFSDPAEAPGLAHFLEHMLFLGTEKYPDENSYSKFLSQHGGSSNAYTDMEHTNFYFDVTHDHLEGALDRFAQFFIAPLFTASATDREMNAVHNENAKNLLNDTWRFFQLSKSIAHPSHPFSKFGTGNLETLRDTPLANGTDVRSLLIQFYERYYSANMMKLVILGREPLDTLQQWAVTNFSAIVNKNLTAPAFSEDVFPASAKQLYKVVPVKDTQSLAVMWSAPESKSHYHTKPWSVISHLIGHEAAGSVCALLKAKGWATELSSGASSSTSCFSALSVTIDLTNEGCNHVDDILEILYYYIELLKQADEQTWRRIFDELAAMSECGFRFQSKTGAQSLATTKAGDMHKYAPEELLTGAWFYKNFDFKLISQYVATLTPCNMVAQITNQTFAGQCDLKERWYKTEYSQAPFASELLQRLTAPAALPELFLPGPNLFIPTDFTLKHEFTDNDRKTAPVQILQKEGLSVWFKPDRTYKVPRANIFVNITSPVAALSPLAQVMTAMFVNLVTDALSEYAYDAQLAGLGYNVSNTSMGMDLTVYGYNHKLMVLLTAVAGKVKNLEVKQDRFLIIKEDLERSYRNVAMEQPYLHANEFCQAPLLETFFTAAQRLAAITTVTSQLLTNHISQLLASLNLEILCHGNLTADEALAMASALQSTLGARPLSLALVPTMRVVNLSSENSYLARFRDQNPQNNNSAICNLFQVGHYKPALSSRLALLAHVINEPCFNELRTNEQLGYLVFSGVSEHAGVVFLRFIIQSSTYPADYLDSRTEAFLFDYRNKLVAMNAETFQANRAAVIAAQLIKDKTLFSESARLWKEISRHRYEFNRADLIVAELEKITLEELVAFWDEHISVHRRKLSVQYFGGQHDFLGNDGKLVVRVMEPPETKTAEDVSAEAKPKLPDAPADPRTSCCVADSALVCISV